MKMLTVGMINCVSEASPHGDYTIVSTTRHTVFDCNNSLRILGETLGYPVEFAWSTSKYVYTVKVLAWERATGRTTNLMFLIAYRRQGHRKGGSWICLNTARGVRPLGLSSGYSDIDYPGSQTRSVSESLVITL